MDLNQQITQLREARGDAFEEMESLHATATAEARDLNDSENKRFTELQAEVRRLDAAQARVTALLDNGGHPRPTHVGDGGDPGEAREQAELIRRCRLIDAIRVQLDDQSVDAGPLREYQAVVQRRDSGRQIRGMVVPVLERRAILASGSGGSLIEETLRDDQFITPLRDRTITGRAGATILPDCIGDQLIPRQTGVVSTGWRGEGSDLPDSDPTFDQLELRPKHVGAVSEWSRNMLLQGSPAVDRLLTDDLVAQIGIAIDEAAISGDGVSPNPQGILNTSGVGSVSFSADDPTHDEVQQLIAAVDSADALLGSLAFAVNPTMAGAMRSTSVDSGSGVFLMAGADPARVADYPAYTTGLVPYSAGTSNLVFGNWTDLLIALWSGVDVLVNPYETSVFKKGSALIRGIQTCDVGLRHAASFAVGGTSQAA